MGASERRPRLWRCPECGRKFANRNQSHSCGVYTVDDFLAPATPAARRLFEALRAALEKIGPIRLAPAKSRVGFQERMIFAAANRLGPDYLDGHLVLPRPVPGDRFRRVERLGPATYVHHFRLTDPRELDDEFEAWLREAYTVGRQERVRRGRSG